MLNTSTILFLLLLYSTILTISYVINTSTVYSFYMPTSIWQWPGAHELGGGLFDLRGA